MKSLQEMASDGAAKLRDKSATMAASWNAAKGRMSAGYGATPFGPTRKANYQAGINAATYRAPDVEKWQRNWTANLFGALWSNLQVITGLTRGNLSLKRYGNPELSGRSDLPKCVETIYPAPSFG